MSKEQIISQVLNHCRGWVNVIGMCDGEQVFDVTMPEAPKVMDRIRVGGGCWRHRYEPREWQLIEFESGSAYWQVVIQVSPED